MSRFNSVFCIYFLVLFTLLPNTGRILLVSSTNCTCEEENSSVCEWSGFDCKNGGYFPPDWCRQKVPCEYCRASSCENWASWELHPWFQCVCPAGTSGVDCGVVEQVTACPERSTLSRDFVDFDNAVELTCKIPKTALNSWQGLRLHSITAQVNLTSADSASILDTMSFRFNIRNKNDNQIAWTQSQIPSDYNQDPQMETCDKDVAFMECHMTHCSVSYVDGDSSHVLYACASGTCDTCAGSEPLCDHLSFYRTLIFGAQENVQLSLLQSGNPGFAQATFSIPTYSVDMECSTGRCVMNETSSGPISVPSTSTSSNGELGGMSLALVLVAVITLVAAATALYFALRPVAVSGTDTILVLPDLSKTGQSLSFLDKHGKLRIPVCGIVFENLTYSIPAKNSTGVSVQRVSAEHGNSLEEGRKNQASNSEQVLLNDVSGVVLPGEFLAVMGPTGAGKSTLLGALTGRVKLDTETSKQQKVAIVFEGSVRGEVHDCVGFVPQHDCLLATETVLETLMFAAHLKQHYQIAAENNQASVRTSEEKRADAGMILAALRLDHRAQTLVGGIDKGGLSGGERKRLSIAVALMMKPSVVILDEPTSGLDSASAKTLVSCLNDLGRTSRTTLVASIHQPPPQVFNSFSNLLLLAPGGNVAYWGPPSEALAWMTSVIGGVSPDMSEQSVSEFLLESVAGEGGGRATGICAEFQKSAQAQRLKDKVRTHMSRADSQQGESGAVQMMPTSNNLSHFPHQMAQVAARQWRQVARDPTLLIVHLALAVAVGLVLGIVFFDLDNELSGIQNRAGFFFMVTLYVSLTSMSALGWFITERRLRWREWSARLYSAPIMLFSTLLCDFALLRLLPTGLICCITYAMVGLKNDSDHFLVFLIIAVLTVSISSTICLIFSAATPDISKANLGTVMTFAFAMMFGGLLTNSGGSNPVMELQYLSFMYYAWAGLMINEFKDIDVIFNPDGFGSIDLTGKVFLDTYGIDPGHLERNIFILVGFQIFLSVVAAVVLFLKLRME